MLDLGGPEGTVRLRSVHPGVSVDDVRSATGFELALPDGAVPTTRGPRADDLVLIREVLDPRGLRDREVRA